MARVDEWVEVAGSSVDLAVDAALRELGLSSRDEVQVEVIREPSKGILGTGWRSQDAVVKVTPKPKEPKKRRRRNRKGKSGGQSKGNDAPSKDTRRTTEASSERSGSSRSKGGGNRSQKKPQERQGRSSGKPSPSPDTKKAASAGGSSRQKRNERPEADERPAETQEATIEEQATVAAGFIEGLLEAFGLEGTVQTEIDDDILKINVTGDQTEALVGRKGAIMQSVHEITRTVVQRKTFGAPRMRLDINGYGERRREALRIYSARQAEQVIADGGEVMLEAMNPADRKVVHDAIGEIDGVESYSEGTEPYRAVVIAPTSS